MDDSPFTTTLATYQSTEPTHEEVVDTFIGTLGNVALSTELLQKRYPTFNQLRFIRILGSNQHVLNEALRTFSLIEAAKVKARMALLLEDSILDLSPADLAKNYIALSNAILTSTSTQPNAQQGSTYNTQINIAKAINDSLPPEVQAALRILQEND